MGVLSLRKNRSRLVSTCESIIDNYERNETSFCPSCKAHVMEIINMRADAAKSEIASWQDYDTDYIQIATMMIQDACYNLLCTGKFHIGRGMLNPMMCGRKLLYVHDRCIDHGLKSKWIDESEADLIKSDLRIEINHAG